MVITSEEFWARDRNSSDVITIVGRDGTITYQSSSLERVFGYLPEDLVGQELRSWLHPEDTDLLLALESRTGNGEDARMVQTRMRHRDGTWRDVETAVTTRFDDPGVMGHVLNSRDVSERVALEYELRARAWHDPLTDLPKGPPQNYLHENSYEPADESHSEDASSSAAAPERRSSSQVDQPGGYGGSHVGVTPAQAVVASLQPDVGDVAGNCR